MSHAHTSRIAQELSLAPRQVAATLALLEEGATIPFMARYRKEATGSLDEVQLALIRDRADQLAQLDKRRESILKSLEERELLSPELKQSVEEAESLTELEDIYLPYRPKRRTRATIAREKGLEPLAKSLLEQAPGLDPEAEAAAFVDAEKGVADVAEALQGARDIIAEQVNEDKEARERTRKHFLRDGIITSKVIRGKEEEGAKFKDYFDWSEAIARIPSHRLLALRRGEKELILSLSIRPEEEPVLKGLERLFVKGTGPAAEQVREAVHDAYKRLMGPSLETEIRVLTKDKADEEAIRVFADNLRQLLLAPPLGSKRVLAVDPGFRTGCKIVALDEQGNLLDHTAIFPHPPQRKVAIAEAVVKDWMERHELEAVAIGNGTASRETEAFFREIGLPSGVPIIMVNEAGASVYSASEVAREEFPNHDVTVRGAVSIGRRLTDPLAELVKIDPKSIGVGQYQHDVDQNLLKKSLDDTVMSCVNGVGVEVNTASKQLLSYVSGLGPSLAENIVRFRAEHGPFSSREELSKVPRLGPKAFEQAAGFLRIREGENPLDASAVHPESYPIVERMAKDLGVTVRDLMADDKLRQQIDLKKYVTETVGLPTLQDVLAELAKPGRDPREKFEVFAFAEGINDITDLREGMELPGIVTNVTNFGAFVDIGVHQDGLVHLSQLANHYVQHPSEVVKVQQQVKVRVVSIDLGRRRIGLSMKDENAPAPRRRKPQHQRRPDEYQSDHIRLKKDQRRRR
ncbi:MAG: RNA-binding transcriptional accessory protein [Bacteroidetes bacterium]|nr:MAG: RNA-binding transcriptional accessory protein [Bacteroidota bacterium]